ncbi:hypothetical protein [Ideonella livida]|uniref:Uncharacterized protein n=1 Tax=Ideonella livida TaxID=2707176 RepID=A0A7C9TKP7_9BURK|nr:hypothetical protein [Ideonella livida]NDY91465.1 hypothetical protein [Ideonella livida]
MVRQATLALFLAAASLAGCSGPTLLQQRSGQQDSLCAASGQDAPVLVLWGAAWPAGVQDPVAATQAAERGLRQFLAQGGCLPHADLMHQVAGRSPVTLSDLEVLRWARAQPTYYERIVLLRLEALADGSVGAGQPRLARGTQVQLRARVLDTASMKLMSERSVTLVGAGEGAEPALGQALRELLGSAR